MKVNPLVLALKRLLEAVDDATAYPGSVAYDFAKQVLEDHAQVAEIHASYVEVPRELIARVVEAYGELEEICTTIETDNRSGVTMAAAHGDDGAVDELENLIE